MGKRKGQLYNQAEAHFEGTCYRRSNFVIYYYCQQSRARTFVEAIKERRDNAWRDWARSETRKPTDKLFAAMPVVIEKKSFTTHCPF